jgi:hypothetical protein
MLAPGGSIGGPAVHWSSAGVSRITCSAEAPPAVVDFGSCARAETPVVKIAATTTVTSAVARHIVFI